MPFGVGPWAFIPHLWPGTDQTIANKARNVKKEAENETTIFGVILNKNWSRNIIYPQVQIKELQSWIRWARQRASSSGYLEIIISIFAFAMVLTIWWLQLA